MTQSSDYSPDMPGPAITDAEVEVLLSRRASADPALADLVTALNRIEISRLGIDLEDRFGRYSLRAATLARTSEAPPEPGLLARLSPRLAAVAMTAILLMGMAGVAVASDAAAPGDVLYGLDRVLENIGVNDGGIQERIDEAEILAERGKATAALNHVADALPVGSNEAERALHRAAESLDVEPNDSDVQEDVGEMLDWMANTDLEARDFGQGVAERAKELGGSQSSGPPASTGNAENGSDSARENGSGKPAGSGNGNGNPTGSGNGNGPPGGTPPGQGR